MSAKVCQVCGEDCSSRPRVRDGQGRYACRACLEGKRQSRRGGERAPAGTIPLAPPEDDAALLAELVAQAPPPQAIPCPQCAGRIDPGHVICTNCGFNTTTGQAVQTRVVKAPKKRKREEVSRKDALASVAVWQRRLIYTILLYLVALVGVIVLFVMRFDELFDAQTREFNRDVLWRGTFLFANIALLGLTLGGLICSAVLMRALRWHVVAIVLVTLVTALLALGCAYFALIPLMVVNITATNALRKGGWRVGFLGAG